MANKNKKIEISSNALTEVTVLSIDVMGRVITSGGEGFSYGILFPQNVFVNSTPVPIEKAISFTKETCATGSKFKAEVKQIIEKQGILIALLTLNVNVIKEINLPFERLKEGTKYYLVVEDVQSDYYKLSLEGLPMIGYIEKSTLDDIQCTAGATLSLRLDRKGENLFQYLHFQPLNDLQQIQTVNCIDRSNEETEIIFSQLFSETERNLLSNEDVEFAKKLIKKYPSLNREDAFLDDLRCLYCRYDSKLEITISSLNKSISHALTASTYWVKYYHDKNYEEEHLLLFNSDDIVILILLENNELVIKELYHDRTNLAAKWLLKANSDACLKLDAGKLHILNKYQSVPYGFSVDDALGYIEEMQNLHEGLLKDLKENLVVFRKDNATDFEILKEIISFEKDKENENNGGVVFVSKESNIERTTSTYYSSGVAFYFDLLSSEYSRLVNEEIDDNVYVSITDENGKPLRSGLLTYDTESRRACIEFPNKDNNIDSDRVREGFYLKKRNATEHLKLQVEALSHFIQNKGASFYDEMMSGSLPAPIITEEIDNIDFYDKKLQEASKDNNQPLAVKRALGNQKVVLVQGPPGTGKTTVIVEIVRQLVKQGRKVLVCSQAHAAVDNIVEKLKEIPQEEQEILSMSIGNEGEEESWGEGFNPEDYKLFLNNNKRLIKHLINGETAADIQQLIENHFIYGNTIAKQYKESHEYILRNYANNPSLYECSESIIEKLLMESDKFSYNLLETCRYQTMDVILGTCIGIGMNKILKRGVIKFDTVIIDEAAKANLAESIVPLQLGERYVLVGDDKQLPPYYDLELIDSYLTHITNQKNVLVHQDDILKTVSISLFQKIHDSDNFPQECVTMLNYQYRMHPDIGEFISKVFYEGKVNMGQNTPMHRLSVPATPFDRQVVFIDTSVGSRKDSGHGSFDRFDNNSYCNDYEADIICEEVIPMLQKSINFREVSIGIITPYRAQRDLLRHSIKDTNLKDCIYTIDSIQGKEFDIVVFSFVRAFKPTATRKVGFLDDMRRLNVSLSRAKKKLILVGHKATLINPAFHIEQDIVGIKPYEVFDKLSKTSISFNRKTKADVFAEKYNIGDEIPCIVDYVKDNNVYVIFKNDHNFRYPIQLFNSEYLREIEHSKEITIKFKELNAKEKPVFEIVSYTDSEKVPQKLISLESYMDIFPLGTIVVVSYAGIDEKGNILVEHLGFRGKILKKSFPEGYFQNLSKGQGLKVRVYAVDNKHQLISFCPLFEENIIPHILDGNIKNFCCTIISKPSFDSVELEFDGGFASIFKIYQPYRWMDFAEINRIYTSISYNKKSQYVLIRKNCQRPAISEKYSIGDNIPCVVDSVKGEWVNVIFKNDTEYSYSIPLFNIDYQKKIEDCNELTVKFRTLLGNKPIFDIVSYVDSKGHKQEVISIESYQEMFPIGKKVVVKYEGPDEQGDIRVRHLGFQGKIPRNTYPDGFFGDLLEGQELTTRVYYVDMMRQMITFCPYFNNDILPDILHGKVKNFVCEIINKPSFGNIELKFDGGKPSIFKLYQPNLWYNFLKTGKTYTSIGYDTTKSHVFVFKNRFFPAFAEKCSKGDVLKGIIAHKGYHSVAIANNYPGYIVDGDISLHDEGDECTLVVEDINEEQMFVTFKMV